MGAFPKSGRLLAMEADANVLTHAIGAGMGIAGIALLVTRAGLSGDAWKIVSFSIFGFSLIGLYLCSTLYHRARGGRWREGLRRLDHAAIPLFIAGSYTPFLLVNLRGAWGWSLLATIWPLGLAAALAAALLGGRFKRSRTALLIGMGWLVAIALPALSRNLPSSALWLLVSGGLAYTGGSFFYLLERRVPFGHAVWHVFVVAGSVCHVLSILFGVLPA